MSVCRTTLAGSCSMTLLAGRQRRQPGQVMLCNQDRISCYAGTNIMLLADHKEQDATSVMFTHSPKKNHDRKRRLATLCRREELENSDTGGRRRQETARTGCHTMLSNQDKNSISCYTGTVMLLVVDKGKDATSHNVGFHKRETLRPVHNKMPCPNMFERTSGGRT